MKLALLRPLVLLVGGRRRGPVMAAVLLAAVFLAIAIPALMGASTSAAAPQPNAGLAASANPNPTPRGGSVNFHWNSTSICWDNLGHSQEGGDHFFNMVVWDPFWWTVECLDGARRDIYIDVLPSNPKGHLNSVDANGTVTGWACDLDDHNWALQVHLYIDGNPALGVYAVTAGEWAGQGVADQCRGNPSHGFTFNIPQQWRDGNFHYLYAVALNVGGGNDSMLNGSPTGFLISPPPPTNTAAPTLSPTTVHPGQTLLANPGSWTGPPGPYTYLHTWYRNGIQQGAADRLDPSYAVGSADVGQTITVAVKACHQLCSAPVPSSNSVVPVHPPPPQLVTIPEHSPGQYVVFQNQEARYYIGLGCHPKAQSIGTWKPDNRHAGPGYISKIVRLVGGEKIVATPTDAAAGALLQGVGVFGTHMARRDLSKSVGSQGWADLGVANANYCWSDPHRPGNLPIVAGVKSASFAPEGAPTVENGDTGKVTMDIVIGNDTQDLLKVRYDYRIKPTVVYQWTTVTVLCHDGLCEGGRQYYVKEPKIVVSLSEANGTDNYTRVSCWDGSNSWSASAAAYNRKGSGDNVTKQYAKWSGNDPTTGTMRCVHGSTPPGQLSGSRGRILFDYGAASSNETIAPVRDCTSPATPSIETCFVATGRGFTPSAPTSLTRWEIAPNPPTTFNGTEGSFDHWAVRSAGLLPSLSANSCDNSMNGPPSNNSNTYPGPDNRRWEIYGRSPNEIFRNERGGIFKAWEGGSSVAGCRHLFKRLGPQNDNWGAFNAYSFSSGWELNP